MSDFDPTGLINQERLMADLAGVSDERAVQIAVGQLCLKYHRQGWARGFFAGSHPSGEFDHMLEDEL